MGKQIHHFRLPSGVKVKMDLEGVRYLADKYGNVPLTTAIMSEYLVWKSQDDRTKVTIEQRSENNE